MKSLYGKKRTGYKGLSASKWTPTPLYDKWNLYCMDNDIRIFPIPTEKGMYPEEWRIGICLGPYKKGEKPYIAPNVYTAYNLFEEIANMKKYYYDKRKIK
tara:strand:+ start:1049 stop:1348 length:300 start_codon:yes stop_codon:yes gene_type:complete